MGLSAKASGRGALGKIVPRPVTVRGSVVSGGLLSQEGNGSFSEVAKRIGNFIYDRPHRRRVRIGRWEKKGCPTEAYRAGDAAKGSPGLL